MNAMLISKNRIWQTKKYARLLPGVLILLVGLSLVACTSGPAQVIPQDMIELAADQDKSEDSGLDVGLPSESEDTSTMILPEVMENPIPEIENGALSEGEIAGLLFMREEEKLARDVYLTLYETWGLPIFNNIAASEQSHTDAVKVILSRYDLPDPVDDDELGVFVNSDLQALYDELVVQGRQSLVEALRVGAAIEEIDILDLEQRLAQTDESAIESGYENLLKGSHNHLRAFVAQLEAQSGEAYLPQYLPVSEYEAIVLASAGQGGRGGRGGNGRNGRNG